MATNNATIKRNNKKSNPNIFVMGVDENYLKVSGTSLSFGRNFNALDAASGQNTCLLGMGLPRNISAISKMHPMDLSLSGIHATGYWCDGKQRCQLYRPH
ncbi:hypothetical protein EMGBS15_17340 [Filimonas sp.]|nr:hypothetical protein EMGBS15_17340 [Filimonas sp.]